MAIWEKKEAGYWKLDTNRSKIVKGAPVELQNTRPHAFVTWKNKNDLVWRSS